MDKNIIGIVDRYYKKKFDRSIQEDQIGFELEFPIIRFGGNIIDMEVIKKFAFFIVQDLGFNNNITYSKDIPVKMENPLNKDLISFEYCFSTLEFSLAPALRLDDIVKRFWQYYEKIMDFLAKKDHMLISIGINPYKWVKDVPIVETDYYKIINIFLKKFKKRTIYKNDYWLSAITSGHTHSSLNEETFIDILNVSNKSEWIKGLLFANSSFWNDQIDPELNLCSRDYFWQDSGLVSNTFDHPVTDEYFYSNEDYYQFLINKLQFICVMRDNNYIFLNGVNLKDYFKVSEFQGKIFDKNGLKNITIKPQESDLDFFKFYYYNVLTKHGTIEMRSNCLQPLNELFAPIAFNIGLVNNYKKIKEFLEFITLKNSMLRMKSTKYQLNNADWNFLNMPLKEFLHLFYDLIKEGIVKRNFGEEKYIEFLPDRIDKLESPGKSLINLLKKGMNLNDIIKRNNQRNF
jgi:gamma-glutamylcysteine synthetase